MKNKKKNKKSGRFSSSDVLKIFAKSPRKKFNHKQIAHHLESASSEHKKWVVKVIDDLLNSNKIKQVGRGQYQYVSSNQFITGTIDFNRRGAAFVTPDNGGKDIYIPPPSTLNALQGDLVEVKVTGVGRNGKKEGFVHQVVSRNKTRFVGVVELESDYAFVIPDNPSVHVDFFIPSSRIENLNDGDKVLVEMVDWPSKAKNPYGKVAEIFGPSGENNAEMHAIVAEFGFETKFDPDVEAAAEALPKTISKEEIAKREDYRKILTFTIDPADAKDFDDALSYQILPNGHAEIGVHIADVSHYVTPKSTIDKEAFNRATSVYLVDRTIPMLPEVLSNGICSLRPHEESLCYAVIFEVNNEAEVLHYRIVKTVIYSDHRYAYEDAQALIESGKGEMGKIIQKVNTLAKKLNAERFANGSINFESDEVKFKLDADGVPTSVYRKVRKDAHKMIEEWMLLANKTVAQHVFTKIKLPIPYRVHEPPRDEKMAELVRTAGRFGHKIDTSSRKEYTDSINKMMKKVEGTVEAEILRPMAIRSMEKAFYTSTKSGHFGLAFEFYAHFTSPIRRYPDLITHRAVFAYINQTKLKGINDMEKACSHSSKMEQKAVSAERASTKYKQTEYLSTRIGEQFEGIISGITEYGIFVEIIENKCEGMVRLRDIRYDRFLYNEQKNSVTGKRTRLELKMGDIVTIEVRKTNINKRNIDLDLIF